MSKPGVILRRPVGSDGPFKEHAELPKDLSRDDNSRRPEKHRAERKKEAFQTIDDKAGRKAASAFEKQQRRRETERRKEQAARERERERRAQAIVKAQAALEKSKREHDRRAAAIEAARAAIERKSQAEEARWEKLKQKLERRAQN